jgi:microcompartment protein CcmK/EutM
MMRGRVVGTIWGTRKVAGLEGRKLALVSELCDGRATGRVVVAIDLLDADAGSNVVVAFGSAARAAVDASGGRATLADAAVVQIVEGDSCS